MSSSSDNPRKDPPDPKKKGKDKPPRESLKAVMSRKKKEMKEHPEPGPSQNVLVDPYANSTASNYITRGTTGIIYDPEVLKHQCEWDPTHPETPQRLRSVIERCCERGLLSLCLRLENNVRPDLHRRIISKHSPDHYNKLQRLSLCDDLPTLELEAAVYDSIYFNKFTFEAACRAQSSVLDLVLAVAQHDVMNGMAFVRPPGHHAMTEEYNGYCFFNNVAVAAEAALSEGHCKRIMIVDFDVHHGQGTQRMFYNRKDVLYFSIHRYEHGYFWPNLLESNFTYVGEGEGLGYNVNVPLNATGLTDDDYLAIILNLLLPIGYEFNPDLIILSAGYDAAVGCPEGKMNVTPGLYAHLVGQLYGLARGKLAVVLEGGYFIPTLSEGASMTLKILLGGPCPILDPVRSVHPSVRETIRNVKRALFGKWNCFKICELDEPSENPTEEDYYKIAYFGVPDKPPFPTRCCYPGNSATDYNYFSKLNESLKERYMAPVSMPVLYVYDDAMLRHAPKPGDLERPERPERLIEIMKTFRDFGLESRLKRIPIHKRNFEPYSPHAPDYFESTVGFFQTKDVYVNQHTQDAVHTAVSGLMCLTDEIMGGTGRSGVAIIRPPGHHAEYETPLGFCFINHVAVAANYLQIKYGIRRILIVDFDIHHGNGTQNLLYTNPHVMYVSIHKDEDGKFFPANSPRNYTHDGHGAGKGFNINIPFNKDKMSDTEYIAAFHNIVLPAAYSFAPEIVLVSAGFDAGINDPLGNYTVNPETFGHLIMMLKPLAEGKMIISLEGGYNLTTTSYGMAICTKVLLGDPIVTPKNLYKEFSEEAIKTIRAVKNHFKQYFDIFAINDKLPNVPIIIKKARHFTERMHGEELTKKLDPAKLDDNNYVEIQMDNLNDYSC